MRQDPKRRRGRNGVRGRKSLSWEFLVLGSFLLGWKGDGYLATFWSQGQASFAVLMKAKVVGVAVGEEIGDEVLQFVLVEGVEKRRRHG